MNCIDKFNSEESKYMDKIQKELLKLKYSAGKKEFKNMLYSINSIISANNFYLEFVCENNRSNYYQRYFRTKKPVNVHSVVYADFAIGYPKELKYGHYAYVHKVQNGKACIVPLVPLGNKRWYRKQELEIVIVNHGMMTPVIMKLDEMRWIDIQRIIENHDTPEKVQTPRKRIINEIRKYLEL